MPSTSSHAGPVRTSLCALRRGPRAGGPGQPRHGRLVASNRAGGSRPATAQARKDPARQPQPRGRADRPQPRVRRPAPAMTWPAGAGAVRPRLSCIPAQRGPAPATVRPGVSPGGPRWPFSGAAPRLERPWRRRATVRPSSNPGAGYPSAQIRPRLAAPASPGHAGARARRSPAPVQASEARALRASGAGAADPRETATAVALPWRRPDYPLAAAATVAGRLGFQNPNRPTYNGPAERMGRPCMLAARLGHSGLDGAPGPPRPRGWPCGPPWPGGAWATPMGPNWS
jgi:hypothetical protein